jgi:hypothetical protein
VSSVSGEGVARFDRVVRRASAYAGGEPRARVGWWTIGAVIRDVER